VTEIQCIESGAAGGAGSGEVEGVVYRATGQVLGDCEIHGVLVFLCAERNECEVIQDGFPDEALDIGGEKTGLERKGSERGEEFGKAVGRHMALDSSRMDGPQKRKCD
jgi:hypothetical protein